MQTTFSLLYQELADYIAKLQTQGWCLPVALRRARHVSHSPVTGLAQYYPPNSMEQKLCLSLVQYQRRSTKQGLPCSGLVSLHPSFVPLSSILCPWQNYLMFRGWPQDSVLDRYVEPTSGADQSFTFLSKPAVPKINTGTPPKENNNSVIKNIIKLMLPQKNDILPKKKGNMIFKFHQLQT